MIESTLFFDYEFKEPIRETTRAIVYDDQGALKLIKALERGINTLSPPDPELIKLLDDMKEVK